MQTAPLHQALQLFIDTCSVYARGHNLLLFIYFIYIIKECIYTG